MHRGSRTAHVAFAVLVCLNGTAAVVRAGSGQRPAVAIGVDTRVVCSVVDALDKGIADAALRVRDLSSGQAVVAARTDRFGQVTLRNLAPGSYVIEVLSGDEVIALGQPFVVGSGETIATFVRLGARPAWFADFFSNAAAAAVASAASLGVTAIGPGAQPSSPQR